MTIFTIEMQLYGLIKMLQERFSLLNSTLKSSISVTSTAYTTKFNMERNHSQRSEYSSLVTCHQFRLTMVFDARN